MSEGKACESPRKPSTYEIMMRRGLSRYLDRHSLRLQDGARLESHIAECEEFLGALPTCLRKVAVDPTRVARQAAHAFAAHSDTDSKATLQSMHTA